MLQMATIAIDLGTTNSRMAAWRDGQVKLILDQGRIEIPSYVAFTASSLLTGAAAKEQIRKNPQNTVFGFKYLIGRRFSDIESYLKFWPFRVVRSAGDKPLIQVTDHGKETQLSPEKITSLFLNGLKKQAELFLKCEVKNTIVSVPSHFTPAQRNAMAEAYSMADLKVLKIIDESTAFALTSILRQETKLQRTATNLLIFNLGEYTLEVSLVNAMERSLKVIAANVHNHLGKKELSQRIVSHVTSDMKMKHKEIDVEDLSELRDKCEEAVGKLFWENRATISINGLKFTIDKPNFELLCTDLFEKCVAVVDQCLKWRKVHEVLHVGCCWFPKLQELLRDYFNGKVKFRYYFGDGVARGAAVYGALLNGEENMPTMFTNLFTRDELLHGAMDIPKEMGKREVESKGKGSHERAPLKEDEVRDKMKMRIKEKVGGDLEKEDEERVEKEVGIWLKGKKVETLMEEMEVGSDFIVKLIQSDKAIRGMKVEIREKVGGKLEVEDEKMVDREVNKMMKWVEKKSVDELKKRLKETSEKIVKSIQARDDKNKIKMEENMMDIDEF